MQIVTDSGTDVSLTPEQAAELNVHVVPLVVTLDGKSYREGVDIKPEDFYPILIKIREFTDYFSAFSRRIRRPLSPFSCQGSGHSFHPYDLGIKRHLQLSSGRGRNGSRGECHSP